MQKEGDAWGNAADTTHEASSLASLAAKVLQRRGNEVDCEVVCGHQGVADPLC